MKRIICLMLAALTCLTACAGGKTFADGTTCEDIMKAASGATEAPVAETVYTDAEGNLDAYTLSLLADADFAECPEYGLLDGYAIYLALGTVTYEVAVLKAKDEAGVQSLYDLLERRKATLAAGDKGMYDPDFELRMEASQLYTDGLYVIFLLTEDNDAAKSAIDALKV